MIFVTAVTDSLDRFPLLDRYLKTRARTRALVGMVSAEARYERPIPLRHPIVFYEGHLPGFGVNTLLKRALGLRGIDAELETLFARGIDPEDERAAGDATAATLWPPTDTVQQFVRAADQAIIDALERADLERPGVSEAVFTILEHEAMHQETLLYIFHELPYGSKTAPGPFAGGSAVTTPRRRRETIDVPLGVATLGASRDSGLFGWDNEFEAHAIQVPAFAIDAQNVANEDFLDFVAADGYNRPSLWSAEGWRWRQQHRVDHPHFWHRGDREWRWRGLFAERPLDSHSPVYVTHTEATAFARWKGLRLPTEAEYMRAAYSDVSGSERAHPWGDDPPDGTRGHFDFQSPDPVAVGSSPAGRSAWGIDDLVGNGWEWTSTVFGPFPGFEPMRSYPEYSADFFDHQHYVLKGASPGTARELIRRSFRNWFRPCYPYVYATFRCVRGLGS